ncbi:uncharacterized protein LOC143297937 [Babylonia areolata]|uniref:uncharacterized protein LOC143297937 n=1 Tax=Babylonia areolata TaxID=304850 RepID=UPI003FD5498E
MMSLCFLTTLAVMFMGAHGQADGGLSPEQLQERCQANSTAVFAHPGQCQLYYNCSNDALSRQSYFTQYLEECPYPTLFSPVTSRCQAFRDVTCGDRLELVDKCDYLLHKCGVHPRYCGTPCHVHNPSCKDLPDGRNVYQYREWSPYFVVCQSNRTVDSGQCARDLKLSIARLFHSQKRRCVTVYEIPREHSGYGLNCANKTDGLHVDDATRRPDVYFRCHGGELMAVERCQKGTYFDELRLICSAQPLWNSIMMKKKTVK